MARCGDDCCCTVSAWQPGADNPGRVETTNSITSLGFLRFPIAIKQIVIWELKNMKKSERKLVGIERKVAGSERKVPAKVFKRFPNRNGYQ